MPKAKYKQRHDNEGFEVPSGQVYRMACCDCGLVHDFVFISDTGTTIGVAARRNNRATAQRRRKLLKQGVAAIAAHTKGKDQP